MITWLLKKGVKREIRKEMDNLHNILHNSFGNIKEDITLLHKSHKEKEQKLIEIEERLMKIEKHLFKEIEKIEKIKPEVIKTNINNEENISNLHETLTHTHQKIFLTLYQLQKRLGNHPISIKSLAKIIYPDKNYANVRSTLSEYLSFLSTMGLVTKIRQGKESLAKITEIGFDYIESLKQEGKFKEKTKIKSKS